MIEISSFEELQPYLHQKMLIIVSTQWCKPCKEVKKSMDEFLKTYIIKDAMIIQMDFDQIQEDEELLHLLKVKKIPSYLMMNDGDLQQSVTSSDWNYFYQFIQENFYIETKPIQISDDF
jgi:thiol-disulfide isomerase/thioredoxin